MVNLNLQRLCKHLFFMPWQLRLAFGSKLARSIAEAIRGAEKTHSGEVRFVVEGALDAWKVMHGVTPRRRAVDVFSELRVWDTERNNGVLIYVLLADRQVEIVADRGVCSRVSPEEWDNICQVMERSFAAGEFEKGSLEGLRLVSEHLARHFPFEPGDVNELPDAPVIR
jgi:uncharacterized membrane protein